MVDPSDPSNFPTERAPDASDPAPSDEPFPCPHCGQMLASTVRVCVACHQPIDEKQIRRAPPPASAAAVPSARLEPLPIIERVRFPWTLFFALLLARLLLAGVGQRYFGLVKTELLLGIVEVVSAVWVAYDATSQRIPRPFLWGVGTLFLWVIIFPWYLVRRRRREASCPFVESRPAPLGWVLVLILVASLLLALLISAGKIPGK